MKKETSDLDTRLGQNQVTVELSWANNGSVSRTRGLDKLPVFMKKRLLESLFRDVFEADIHFYDRRPSVEKIED